MLKFAVSNRYKDTGSRWLIRRFYSVFISWLHLSTWTGSLDLDDGLVGTRKVVAKEKRWYKDIGLGYKTPQEAISGTYVGQSPPSTTTPPSILTL